MSDYNYIVEITPISHGELLDNPDLGMFGGVMRWAEGYDSTYTPANSSTGFLGERWLSPLSKGATVANRGNTEAVGGGTITAVGTKQLFKWMRDYDVKLYNAKIEILENLNGGAYSVIRSGVVTQSANEIVNGKIPFQDQSKTTTASITSEIEGTGKYRPVNFGTLPYAKTVSTKPSGNDLNVFGNGSTEVAVFKVVNRAWETYNDFATLDLSVPYLDEIPEAILHEYSNKINAQINAGGCGVRQGNNIFPLEWVGYNGTTKIYTVKFKTGNLGAEGGIQISALVENYVTFEAFGITAYSDDRDVQFNSKKLYNYNSDNSEFEELPEVRDAEEFFDHSLSITDNDSEGWDLIPWTAVEDNMLGDPRDGASYYAMKHGELEYLTDGKANTYRGVEAMPEDLQFAEVTYYTTLKVDPMDEKPKSCVFDGILFTKLQDTPSSLVQVRIGVTVYDEFGNTYEPYPLASPWRQYTSLPRGNRQWQCYWNNPCYLYTTNTGETEGRNLRTWKWVADADAHIPYGTGSGTPVAKDEAGYRSTIDLSSIPETVWKTGFKITIATDLYTSNGQHFLNYVNVGWSLMQLLKKSDFKPDAVYVDVEGRKDETIYPISDMGDIYKHAVQMQNLSSKGIAPPVHGWGSDFPTVPVWGEIYSYSDIDKLSVKWSTTAIQIMKDKQCLTSYIKSEVCRLTWSLGYTDKNGLERIRSMTLPLHSELGTLIKYTDLFLNELPVPKDRPISGVFCNMVAQYGYNTATEANKSVITVSGADTEAFEDSGSSGSPDIISLWKMARELFKTYGVINDAPAEMKNCYWHTRVEDAEQYLKEFYMWQGVVDTDGTMTVRQRYAVPLQLAYRLVEEKNLDIGSGIQLQISGLTYYNGAVGTHSGVVTAIKKNIAVPEPYIVLTCEMLGNVVSGSNKIVYIETGSATTEIIETGSQTTEVIEGL